MGTDAYTLKQMKDTDELHLFRGHFTEKACTSGDRSLCEKMEKTSSEGNRFACKTEDEARLECARIGRQVCGTCVSNLYATYR